MDKCRICLKDQRKMNSIFDECNNTSYAQMIMYVSKLKIVKDDQVTKAICDSCKGRLQEAYLFIQLIEKSNLILHENNQLRKVFYYDYEDLKLKIESLKTSLKCPILLRDNFIQTYFTNGTSCITYNNTIIKRNEVINNMSLKLKHLNTIENEKCEYKEETNGYIDEDANDQVNYETKIDNCDVMDDDKHLKTKSNKTKIMLYPKYFYKLASPIKPAFITDVRLLRVSDTNKKYTSKKRPERVCPYCGKISKSLRQHIFKHTAEGDKKYKCDMCSKAYNTKALLKSHLLRHTAKKNFNCDQCFATFFDEFELKRHKISHSTEKGFSCSICNKAFKRKFTLKRHSLVHNLSNRKINCGLCSMSFITKEGLKNHMLVHTEERQFCCEICSQPYKNKRDFVQHCFKKHGVALKRRPVSVMNEEVLIQEKALMRKIMLRMQGGIQDDKLINPFEGPQANLAFQNVIKLLKRKQLSIDL